MDRLNIEQTIAEFLASTAGRPMLTPDLDLIELGIIDSLTMMDLLVFVEASFGVRLGFDDLTPATFQSIGSIAAVIDARSTRRSLSSKAA